MTSAHVYHTMQCRSVQCLKTLCKYIALYLSCNMSHYKLTEPFQIYIIHIMYLFISEKQNASQEHMSPAVRKGGYAAGPGNHKCRHPSARKIINTARKHSFRPVGTLKSFKPAILFNIKCFIQYNKCSPRPYSYTITLCCKLSTIFDR